jgi:hypothetical protein
MFREIWEERPHRSEISGKKIKHFSLWCFAHVISKGSEPKGRLDKANIVLCTPEEHQLYDNVGVEGLKEWEWVLLLKDLILKPKYNRMWK